MIRPPLDDPRVRRALVLGTDRETLASVVMKGFALPASGGLLPPGIPGHSSGIGLPFNPARARHLLGQSGYSGGRGLRLRCLSFEHPPFAAVTRFLEEQWRSNLGIDTSWETDWESTTEHRPHALVKGYMADYPDPHDWLKLNAVRDWGGWRHAEYEHLMDQAGQAMDQQERLELSRKADRILVEEAPIMPLVYPRWQALLKPRVTRYPTSPIRLTYYSDVVIERISPSA